MTLQIGDEVEVINGRDYSITTTGSQGIVTAIEGNNILVRFTLITSVYTDYLGYEFEISKPCLSFLCYKTPIERVCDKVKLMHSRQVKRGVLYG